MITFITRLYGLSIFLFFFFFLEKWIESIVYEISNFCRKGRWRSGTVRCDTQYSQFLCLAVCWIWIKAVCCRNSTVVGLNKLYSVTCVYLCLTVFSYKKGNQFSKMQSATIIMFGLCELCFSFLRKTHDQGCDFSNKEVETLFSFCFVTHFKFSQSAFQVFFSFQLYVVNKHILQVNVLTSERTSEEIYLLHVDNSQWISMEYVCVSDSKKVYLTQQNLP